MFIGFLFEPLEHMVAAVQRMDFGEPLGLVLVAPAVYVEHDVMLLDGRFKLLKLCVIGRVAVGVAVKVADGVVQALVSAQLINRNMELAG